VKKKGSGAMAMAIWVLGILGWSPACSGSGMGGLAERGRRRFAGSVSTLLCLFAVNKCIYKHELESKVRAVILSHRHACIRL